MARPARRRPGLAGQRRQRAGEPPAHLARRHHRRLDLDPRRRPRGAHRARRRRPRPAPHPLGQRPDPGTRLDRRRTGPRPEHLRPGQPAPQLGPCRAARRGTGRDPAVRARRRCRGRPAHRAAVRPDGPRGRLVEALPGRHGRQALDRPRGRRRVRPAARRTRRQHRVPLLGRRPHRLPLRPRGHRRSLLLPRRRLRPAPAHASRGHLPLERSRERGRLLRPARRDRRHPRRLLVRR